VLNGDNVAAREYLNSSIAKKSNYADAYFLLTQIELAENNTQEAIQSAERAAILSPNNAGVFFQVGLLKYNALDYVGAVEALDYAIRLAPDYANAMYFLGLSLDNLDRSEEALALFEALAESNPDNEEVGLILENLREGRAALDGIPSSAADISERTTPPITENE